MSDSDWSNSFSGDSGSDEDTVFAKPPQGLIPREETPPVRRKRRLPPDAVLAASRARNELALVRLRWKALCALQSRAADERRRRQLVEEAAAAASTGAAIATAGAATPEPPEPTPAPGGGDAADGESGATPPEPVAPPAAEAAPPSAPSADTERDSSVSGRSSPSEAPGAGASPPRCGYSAPSQQRLRMQQQLQQRGCSSSVATPTPWRSGRPYVFQDEDGCGFAEVFSRQEPAAPTDPSRSSRAPRRRVSTQNAPSIPELYEGAMYRRRQGWAPLRVCDKMREYNAEADPHCRGLFSKPHNSRFLEKQRCNAVDDDDPDGERRRRREAALAWRIVVQHAYCPPRRTRASPCPRPAPPDLQPGGPRRAKSAAPIPQHRWHAGSKARVRSGAHYRHVAVLCLDGEQALVHFEGHSSCHDRWTPLAELLPLGPRDEDYPHKAWVPTGKYSRTATPVSPAAHRPRRRRQRRDRSQPQSAHRLQLITDRASTQRTEPSSRSRSSWSGSSKSSSGGSPRPADPPAGSRRSSAAARQESRRSSAAGAPRPQGQGSSRSPTHGSSPSRSRSRSHGSSRSRSSSSGDSYSPASSYSRQSSSAGAPPPAADSAADAGGGTNGAADSASDAGGSTDSYQADWD